MVARGGASMAKRFVCWLKHVELTSSANGVVDGQNQISDSVRRVVRKTNSHKLDLGQQGLGNRFYFSKQKR